VATDFPAYRYATRPIEEAVSDTRDAPRIIQSGSIFVVSSSTKQTTAIAQVMAPVVLAELHAAMKGRPVYLSWDMDSFDPSVAPSVCTPTWGGFTAREGLQLLRGLSGLDIVAIDINTVSPSHDINGMAAHLAAYMTYEILLLIEERARRVL
jgi:arginase family enzyme